MYHKNLGPEDGEIVDFRMYQYVMSDYTTAPAAFGVYTDPVPLAVPISVPMQFQTNRITDITYNPIENPYDFGNYHKHTEGEMSHISWDSEYITQETKESVEDHVNPANIEGSSSSCINESSQTLETSSQHSYATIVSKKKNKARSVGVPTNIILDEKMDRKTLKRLRNRVSASRCRVKKKEWIIEMEDQSIALYEENKLLLKEVAALEESIESSRKYLQFCKDALTEEP